MQPIDFSKLIDAEAIESVMAQQLAAVDCTFQDNDGVQVRSRHGGVIQDTVRLGDGAFLFASDYSPGRERKHLQIINDSDWVHIQFRLSGGGREQVSEAQTIETPEKSCIVARYPKNSVIGRSIDPTDHWRAVCLFVTPKGLTDFMDTPAMRLPQSVSWLTLQSLIGLRSSSFPLRSNYSMTIHDILSCSFQGSNRRAYMRAKSLELLSMVIHTLDAEATRDGQAVVSLSAADLEKISLSRAIMTENLENNLTLAQLARRVGLNRTKLALGFKKAYGTSVQAYWRDARLSRARELLCMGEARVTEVALGMGYSELSSFTRAFSRKFGVLPRDCRSSATQERQAHLLGHSASHD
jgi:AraC family transcriptional regulator, transcriptional activator of the genes for pyochelin and ferripyochelin receptors